MDGFSSCALYVIVCSCRYYALCIRFHMDTGLEIIDTKLCMLGHNIIIDYIATH
jgi:hypothetical protein